ncbi:hypothetical protein E2C01_039604 [Portunus trituberculatus]|uniref:Uncharacterized protein n=1 Tax=Portunus trituberculatus TaxID=210409 RepID=A0A5B7FLR6_PORTR|nr:hypothetical protein [Portunus trituberculatus]
MEGSDQTASRLCGSLQSKISPGAHDRKSFRDRSAVVSIEPAVIPSVSDLASCEKDALAMESSDNVVTAAHREPTVAKSAVRPEPRPLVPGRNDDNSHHSPVGRKGVVHQPGTSQLLVSSHRVTVEAFAPRGGNSEFYYWSSLQLESLYRRLCSVIVLILILLAIVPFPGQGHHGGTAILVRSSIPVVPLQLSSPLQADPRTSGRFTKRPVPWWNSACTTAVRKKRAAISRLWRHRGDPEYLGAFRRCCTRARRVLREAQRASWKVYVSSINVRTALTDVFNKVR